MRSIFFGTPDLSAPSLDALSEVSEVVGVVCQPDRPAGRGMGVACPAIKLRAQTLGLDLLQPEKVRDGRLEAWMSERRPDFALVLAYGRILPPPVLSVPRLGCLNLHASLLPRHRGAAPIEWSILSGDPKTGVSLMQMEEGLDTGPVFVRRELAISPNETGEELKARLKDLSANMVREDLPEVLAGRVPSQPQDPTFATWAPPLSSADRILDLNEDGDVVMRKIRAFSPRPGAITYLDARPLRIISATFRPEASADPPGTLRVTKPCSLSLAVKNGTLDLACVQLPGKRPMVPRDVINGRLLQDGIKCQSKGE